MDATDDMDGKAPAVRRASIQGQSNPSVSSVKSVIKAREYPADKQPKTNLNRSEYVMRTCYAEMEYRK
jgi:hypothetical protein